MAFMGPLLATVGKGIAKGAEAGAKKVGQRVKNTLKQRFGGQSGSQSGEQSGGQQKQKQPMRAPMQITPPTFAGSKVEAPHITGSMKEGGPVRKTGLYHLHKNEHVIPAGGTKARIVASQGRALLPPRLQHKKATHAHRQITKVVGSQVRK